MTLMEKYAGATAYTGAGAATIFGLTLTDFGALLGIALGIATFCLNWWYKQRTLKALEAKKVIVLEDAS